MNFNEPNVLPDPGDGAANIEYLRAEEERQRNASREDFERTLRERNELKLAKASASTIFLPRSDKIPFLTLIYYVVVVGLGWFLAYVFLH